MGWFTRLIEDGAKEWHMRARVATGIRPGSNPPAMVGPYDHGEVVNMQWQSIEKAPNDTRIVMAYFGPNKIDGLVSVGHFFKYESMPERLATGWPSSESPTHWIAIPERPAGAS